MTNPTFADLGVSDGVVRALASRGVTEPFAVQTTAIPDAMAGRDVLVRSKTGSGKTLAFAIPIVERTHVATGRPGALVLAPTRELAVQVAGELSPLAATKNLRVALAYGGTSVNEQGRNAKRAHILVATPGRLEDLIERGYVRLDSVSILVLDEADHMLDMGFLPQVERIVDRVPRDRQTMLFSATLDGEVGAIAKRYTRNPVRHEIASPAETVVVEHQFVAVGGEGKSERLADLLRGDASSTLVFVRTKRGADRLVRTLAGHGIAADAMHGNKTQSQREKALARFASGRVAALVATDVAARGIDVRAVARVVNYDVPDDDKAFVHRVGRTGRAGLGGTSITFVAPEQRNEVRRMATRLKLHAEFDAAHGPAQGRGNGRTNGRGHGASADRPHGRGAPRTFSRDESRPGERSGAAPARRRRRAG